MIKLVRLAAGKQAYLNQTNEMVKYKTPAPTYRPRVVALQLYITAHWQRRPPQTSLRFHPSKKYEVSVSRK